MEKYKFDITPHIVKQLGEQLVPDEVTALLELIKNSYDADASYVSIEINTSGKYFKNNALYPLHKGYIVVEDDGFGMNEKTILKSWMVISYSEKRKFKENKQKTPKGRTPLGDKGLGRLSTQRLADKCEIFTKKENENGIHVAFDWKNFEKEEQLSKVEVLSTEYDTNSNHGTILLLSDIKNAEAWKGKNLEKFKGQVSQLISPYKEDRPFEVYISINGISIDLEKSNDNLRDLAISRFEFYFQQQEDNPSNYELLIKGKSKLTKFRGNSTQKWDEYNTYLQLDKGKKFGNFLTHRLPYIIKSSDKSYFLEFEQKFDFLKDIPDLQKITITKAREKEKILANPGSFEGKIDEYSFGNKDDFNSEAFGSRANYKEFAQNQSGIKIYRNGFAVLPYGVENKDWLKLSESQTKTTFYDLRPTNTIGYFSIDEGVNFYLKDKTDRQGFVSNAYTENFLIIASFIINTINTYQRNIRRTYDKFLKEHKVENNGVKTVSESFNELNSLSNSVSKIDEKEITETTELLNSTIVENQSIVDDVENNSLFSKVSDADYNKAKNLLVRLKTVQINFKKFQDVIGKSQKIQEVINVLEPKIQVLEEQLEDFTELASLGLTAETVSHEFANIADNLAEKANFYTNKLNNKQLTEGDIYVLIEYINSTVNGLKVQLKHLDPALKYNREKKQVISISSFFETEKKYYERRFDKAEISFLVKVVKDFNIKVNRGRLTQIVDNIIINSEYWLKHKKKSSNYSPKITVVIDEPWIYISDNGYGIPKSIENHLFEPFVSTKPKGEGRGLGLFIVNQLLDSINCSISLDSERNTEGRKYIFVINLANISE